MKTLKDQQSNIVKESNGYYSFTLNNVYQSYSTAYDLLYQYYASLFVFDHNLTMSEKQIEEFVKSYYETAKTSSGDSDKNFVIDYEYFLSSDSAI